MRASCPRRIGPLERRARRLVLLAPEQIEAIIERPLIDAIGADGGGQAACDLRECLRLPDVQPDDECA